ncbi:MAG: hypothetical protein QNJ64_08385 [Crocosphaera sp.]|nr:hypothetical protein [Crocosphaera sp.]
MTQHYLSLVLVEVPDHVEGTPYKHWFQCVGVDSLKIKNGLLEIVFFDGTIKVFNFDESEDILFNCPEYLHEYLNSQDS